MREIQAILDADPDSFDVPYVPRELREYLESNLRRYRVPWSAYLAQVKKEDDPRATEQVGIGPFKKRVWTLVSEVEPRSAAKGKK